MELQTVPEPPGVAALPRDPRGIPIPAHVPREMGVPRLAAVDPLRLLILSGSRRCTICAWSIGRGELCWYPTSKSVLKEHADSLWTKWDISLEGAGHLECMMYASIVCPFLRDPAYRRTTDQVGPDNRVRCVRGTPRGTYTLVGREEVQLIGRQNPMSTVIGRGTHALVEFNLGKDLLPELRRLLSGSARSPDLEDLRVAALLASSDAIAIQREATKATFVAQARLGHPIPKRVEPGENCWCGSSEALETCCYPRMQTAAALAKSDPLDLK